MWLSYFLYIKILKISKVPLIFFLIFKNTIKNVIGTANIFTNFNFLSRLLKKVNRKKNGKRKKYRKNKRKE